MKKATLDEIVRKLDAGAFTDYERVKGRLSARLAHTCNERARLSERPHRIVEGLAVIYHVLLERQGNDTVGFYITSPILKELGVTEDELYRTAMQNLKREKPCFDSMQRALSGLLDMEEDILDIPPTKGLYVLSNERKYFGASMILNPDALNDIEDKIGPFYILPSSVHEVIVLPKDTGIDIASLREMVRDINMAVVEAHERLSDQVYVYDRAAGHIRVAEEAAGGVRMDDCAREIRVV